MTDDEKRELLARTVALLSEHFDAVQILASWNEEGLTKADNKGAGNWYARIGMARSFLKRDEAQEARLRDQ